MASLPAPNTGLLLSNDVDGLQPKYVIVSTPTASGPAITASAPHPPSQTGHLLCNNTDCDSAEHVVVDCWVPVETIDRLHLFRQYSVPVLSMDYDVLWVSQLMLEWPEDLEVRTPDIVPFTEIYDNTHHFTDHDDHHCKTSRFFNTGDIVLLELLITRYKPKSSKTTGWSLYQVGFELQTIDVVAKNPTRPNGFSHPSIPPPRSEHRRDHALRTPSSLL
ncbi:hypothetical protein LXA43DRAFT_1103007 [Ganoderma leucocontextum]|nr:hypothetical protein LXA43DRAFT_1103007 [Ganoderma leucocontextum]